jgi:hypothetical protein
MMGIPPTGPNPFGNPYGVVSAPPPYPYGTGASPQMQPIPGQLALPAPQYQNPFGNPGLL